MSSATAFTEALIGLLSDDASIPGNDCLVPEGTSAKGATHCQQTLSGQEIIHDKNLIICNITVTRRDRQKQLRSAVCKNVQSLCTHKNKLHSGQKICNLTLVGEDGQPRVCGTVFKNTMSLAAHKSRYHSGEKTCEVTVFTEEFMENASLLMWIWTITSILNMFGNGLTNTQRLFAPCSLWF
ncbi:hypothetical protein [Endozoicomonas sp. 2B-B]